MRMWLLIIHIACPFSLPLRQRGRLTKRVRLSGCALTCLLHNNAPWTASWRVLLRPGWQSFHCQLMAMTCLPRSSATSWPFAIIVKLPAGLPSTCDGCGAPFSLQHGLDCAKGGLVKRGHDDIRDNDARLADMAWGGVSVEPIMIPENDRRGRS